MSSAYERRSYYEMLPLIGWTHTQNDHWLNMVDSEEPCGMDLLNFLCDTLGFVGGIEALFQHIQRLFQNKEVI